MIRLGLDDDAKRAAIAKYVADHAIRHVVIVSPARFRLDYTASSHEHVEWAEVILYKFYYRLLQEIDKSTLLVINECLRSQNRNDLTYNCIRNYLQQTPHQIVFQYLPILDATEDLGILVDFDTRSRWKREPVRTEMLADLDLVVRDVTPAFEPIAVAVDDKTRATYARDKRALLDGIGLRDPHTIPRTLHLLAGKAKADRIDPLARYAGRNNRFALPNLQTYGDVESGGARTLFEFCHNVGDMAAMLAITRQTRVPALVSDLKVDGWYLQRYVEWSSRIRAAYALLGTA